MTAGASSTIATNPLWVIKTRFMVSSSHARMLLENIVKIMPITWTLQTQRVKEGKKSDRYRHTFDAFSRIYAQEGLRGFYRGLVPSLFGVSHVAIQFPLYEQIKLYYSMWSIKFDLYSRI